MSKTKAKKKGEKDNNTGAKIFNIAFWAIFALVLIVWTVDYVRAQTDNDPIFCLTRVENEYADGVTTICTGLGYRIINYDREAMHGIEYGPFWIQEIQPES